MVNPCSVFHLKPTGRGGLRMKTIVVPNSLAVRAIGRADLDSEDKHIQFISRQHVEVSCSPSGDFFVTPVSRQPGLVFVNGSSIPDNQPHKLQIGDTVTLLGKLNYFNYVLASGSPEPSRRGDVIDLVHEDDDAVGVHAAASSSSSKQTTQGSSNSSSNSNSSSSNNSRKRERDQQDSVIALLDDDDNTRGGKKTTDNNIQQAAVRSNTAVSGTNSSSSSSSGSSSVIAAAPPPAVAPTIQAAHLESHYECSICFEALAHTHTINPCGDNFCYSCIVDWAEKTKKCPMCNAPFDVKNLLPNRIVDNLIGEVLKLDQDKLQAWQQRCEEGNDRKKAAAAVAGGGGGGGKKGAKKAGGRGAAAAAARQPPQPDPRLASAAAQANAVAVAAAAVGRAAAARVAAGGGAAVGGGGSNNRNPPLPPSGAAAAAPAWRRLMPWW